MEKFLIVKLVVLIPIFLLVLVLFVIMHPFLRAGTSAANSEMLSRPFSGNYSAVSAPMTFWPLLSGMLLVGMIVFALWLVISPHVRRDR